MRNTAGCHRIQIEFMWYKGPEASVGMFQVTAGFVALLPFGGSGRAMKNFRQFPKKNSHNLGCTLYGRLPATEIVIIL